MGGAMVCKNAQSIKVPEPVKRFSEIKATTSYENIHSIYTFDKVVGKGSYGVVREGFLKTDPGKKVAIKIIEKERIRHKVYLLEREITILQTLDHPNIINFFETYQDFKYFYIVMEYCSGGELLDRLIDKGRLHEYETRTIMYKLFSGLNYIHKKKIAHRDLKPENVLFSDNTHEAEIKIIDFGLSNMLRTEETSIKRKSAELTLHTKVGTPNYVAPEILKGEYTIACDIWSLGIITYLLLCGNPPFFSETEEGLYKKIEKGLLVFKEKEWEKISVKAKDLILKCLKANPKKRITAEQAIKHPWFADLQRKSFLVVNKDSSEPDSPNLLNKHILNVLQNNKFKNKLKREVLKIFVNRLNEKEIITLKNAFQTIDEEHRGAISCAKLMEVMKLNGLEHSEAEIRDIIQNIKGGLENSENIYLNYTEFISATLDLKTHFDRQKLWNLFKYFDTKNKNYVTAEDLKEIMARGGRRIPVEELQAMIKEQGLEKEGKLYFEDFCKMLDVEEVLENQELKEKEEKEGKKERSKSFCALKE